MKKMLTSVWFAVAIGLVGFAITLGVLWGSSNTASTTSKNEGSGADTNIVAAAATNSEAHVEEPAPAPAPEPEAPALPTITAEPGAHSFTNPEVDALIQELTKEVDQYKQKNRELKNFERQLALEREHFGGITQTFLKAKAEMLRLMTNQLTVVHQKETNKLRQLAVIYTNMPPSNAVAILDNMPVDEVARILDFMKEREKASILENFATNTNVIKGSMKATEISDRLRKLNPAPIVPPDPEVPKNPK